MRPIIMWVMIICDCYVREDKWSVRECGGQVEEETAVREARW